MLLCCQLTYRGVTKQRLRACDIISPEEFARAVQGAFLDISRDGENNVSGRGSTEIGLSITRMLTRFNLLDLCAADLLLPRDSMGDLGF